MLQEGSGKLKLALIGATGAVGLEMVELLAKDKRFSEVSLVIRKKHEDWNFPENSNIRYIDMPSVEGMSELKEKLNGYNIFLCTLGSRVGRGTETFLKVDYHYPMAFCKLAKECGAKYYGVCSSGGADANSRFLYMRTKGEVERDLKAIPSIYVAIFRPGMLANRNGEWRIGEKLALCLCACCIPKNDTRVVASTMI